MMAADAWQAIGIRVIGAHGRPGRHVSETEGKSAVNYRKPPLYTRFKKDQSGDPAVGPQKTCRRFWSRHSTSEPVFVTLNGRWQKIAKRGAIVAQLY